MNLKRAIIVSDINSNDLFHQSVDMHSAMPIFFTPILKEIKNEEDHIDKVTDKEVIGVL